MEDGQSLVVDMASALGCPIFYETKFASTALVHYQHTIQAIQCQYLRLTYVAPTNHHFLLVVRGDPLPRRVLSDTREDIMIVLFMKE